jgi:hypothetical protein
MLRRMARQTTPDHKTDLTVLEDGRVYSPELSRLGAELRVTFVKDSGGRDCIGELTVSHPEGVTGTLLRQLPLVRIERLRNFVQSGGISEQTFIELRQILAARPGKARHRNLPERFFELIAVLYTEEAAGRVPAPALAIAEATGTPLSTVKGWVHRTRLRRLLPPARSGRAG